LNVDPDTGEILTTSDVRIACKDRRTILCPSCAAVYKADAWFLVTAGLAGGKGMPETLTEHPRLFLTLTAPTFGAVHTIADDSACRPRFNQGCGHGRPEGCGERHDPGDDVLGSPLCEECFDWEGAVLWNATSSRLWNRTIERCGDSLLPREVSASLSFESRWASSICGLQRRNAEGSSTSTSCFEQMVLRQRAHRLDGLPRHFSRGHSVDSQAIATTEVPTGAGNSAGWGSQLEIADLGAMPTDAARVAGYVANHAKYVTKTTGGSIEFARSFAHRLQIERLDTLPHLRRMALTAWRLGGRKDLRALRLWAHAHTLGYRGQLMTKSRGYSTTFASLRGARIDFRAAQSREDPIKGTFGYEGRGYDDPDTARLAEMFFKLEQDTRREARRSMRADQCPNRAPEDSIEG
jgi:hypothetical protein